MTKKDILRSVPVPEDIDKLVNGSRDDQIRAGQFMWALRKITDITWGKDAEYAAHMTKQRATV